MTTDNGNAAAASGNGNAEAVESEFDRALRVIEDAQRAPDVLRTAQAELAPVRARAEAALVSLDAAIARHRPFFDDAGERHNRAKLVGVRHMELFATLMELGRLIVDGRHGLLDVINEINRLTAYEVHNQWHKHIPAKLNICVTPAHLDELARRAQIYLAELEQRVIERAGAPATVGG